MRTLAQVKTEKFQTVKNMREVERRVTKLRLELCEHREYLRELEDLEKMFYESEVGVTKCPTHNFCAKNGGPKTKKRQGDNIAEKFKTLSKTEQANLLQLLTMGESNE